MSIKKYIILIGIYPRIPYFIDNREKGIYSAHYKGPFPSILDSLPIRGTKGGQRADCAQSPR